VTKDKVSTSKSVEDQSPGSLSEEDKDQGDLANVCFMTIASNVSIFYSDYKEFSNDYSKLLYEYKRLVEKYQKLNSKNVKLKDMVFDLGECYKSSLLNLIRFRYWKIVLEI
jgi:hypothetical protein